MPDGTSHSGGDRSSKRDESGSKQTFQWSDGVEPSVRIVEAIAEVTGCEPTSLPPLSDAIDVDAMNQLLTRASDDQVQLRLTYADRTVEAQGDGTIHVSTH